MTTTDRRSFLKLGGMTLLLSAVNPSLARASRSERLRTLGERSPSGKRLVYIFLRFGQDGLNTLVPYEAGEHATYMSYRPQLGIPRNLLDPYVVGTDFALSPVMAGTIYQLYQNGQVALLPTTGYPNSSRSHFDSQLFVDNGVPFSKQVADGWLNRYLQANPGGEILRALAFNAGLPYSLSGPSAAMSFFNLDSLVVSGDPVRNQKYLDSQRQVYGQAKPPLAYRSELGGTGTGLLDAIDQLTMGTLPPPTPAIPYPNGNFGTQMSQLAQLIKSGDFGIEVAEVDRGGWDHHANQQDPGNPLAGTYPGMVQEVMDAIYAFVTDLGPLMDDTIILTSSEFGRTARQNGSMGTDHGNAWLSMVIGGTGGNVAGGVYLGSGWPGLTNLRENRDLRHTIDFRDVHYEALSRHLGGDASTVFPDWTPTPVGFL